MIKYLMLFMLLAARDCPSTSEKDMNTYQVQKVSSPIVIDAQWDKAPWTNIKALQIKNYMGDKPEHIPLVEAKLAYDEEAIYVIFRVEDRYVKAIASKNQDGVFKDSCVEFFFSPEDNSTNGYFNLEMNCGGTMLFHHQMQPRKDSKHISEEDIAKIQVASTLPKIVDPEITDPTTWSVEYRIPFEILQKYHSLEPPTAGTVWRGNLYKCADDTSHPHWLTWSPIDLPKPNFHVPAAFGQLKFI